MARTIDGASTDEGLAGCLIAVCVRSPVPHRKLSVKAQSIGGIPSISREYIYVAAVFNDHAGTSRLQNHLVMCPLMRSRATGNVPNDLMIEYYSQRASAGMIIAEGTLPSPNGLG